MINILVTSPYLRQYAYPSFWHLLDYFDFHNFNTFNPINDVNNIYLNNLITKTKIKHIYPIIYAFFLKISGKKIDVVITFGVFQIPSILILKIIFPSAKFITYQPELFEFSNKLLTLIFKLFINRYDLLVDVDPIRLKLRRRLFKIKNSIFLPNFNHKIEKDFLNNKFSEKYLYAGVIDSEQSIINMCNKFEISLINLDCYITKNLSGISFKEVNYFEPQDFSLISAKGYGFGLICYPFKNRVRKDLNNKYCAPSKIFTYFSYGIFPLHYDHPTLRKFTRLRLSSNNISTHLKTNTLDIKLIQKIFDDTGKEVSIAFDLIINNFKV